MSSFKDGLRRSGQSVLDARAQNLYEMTKIEEERFIQECKMKVLRIKNELNKHRDLSVKSTTSLEVGNGFDPKAWVAKRHQLERDLRVANIEYALALKVDGEEFPAEGEAKAAANRALVSAGLTPAERAEWDYKTAVGVAQALAESKVSWVPSVMFGGGSSSNSAMDAVGLKMLLDITKSLEKTSK